jgi:hypothetical protein
MFMLLHTLLGQAFRRLIRWNSAAGPSLQGIPRNLARDLVSDGVPPGLDPRRPLHPVAANPLKDGLFTH